MESKPPEPYEPQSLLGELISLETLQHLITGFSDKLGTGVVLYCYDQHYRLRRVEPETGSRFWSEICKRFRKDRRCCDECIKFDEQISREFLGSEILNPRVHPCSPLGLVDMAAQIVVRGKPLGVVLAGQRMPVGVLHAERVRARIRERCPDRVAELEEAWKIERFHLKNFSPEADEMVIREHLDKLKDFATLIAGISETVAERQAQVRQQDFLEYWTRTLSDSRPATTTAWQQSLQSSLVSFRTFLGDQVRRISFYHGDRRGNQLVYSLIATDPFTASCPQAFSVAAAAFDKPSHHGSDILPELLRSSSSAPSDCFYLYPFAQGAAKSFGEVFSLVIIQSRQGLSEEHTSFCNDFSSNVSRRHATITLFLRQMMAYDDFEQQVTGIRHDLITSVQHLVANTEHLIRAARRNSPSRSSDESDLIQRIKLSIKDHTARIHKLAVPQVTASELALEGIDVFDAVRNQAVLFEAMAQDKGLRIDITGLPRVRAVVFSDRSEVDRAIAALLHNAIKYSYHDRCVRLAGLVEAGKATIVFENYGIGIPPRMLTRIQTRFCRANVADTQVSRPGTGLGLAIASHVFQDLLRGTLRLKSERPASVVGPTEQFHRYVTQAIVQIPVHVEEPIYGKSPQMYSHSR